MEQGWMELTTMKEFGNTLFASTKLNHPAGFILLLWHNVPLWDLIYVNKLKIDLIMIEFIDFELRILMIAELFMVTIFNRN